MKDTTLSHAVEHVAVLDGDTAVVKGRYRLNGLKVFGFERSPEGAFVFRHKKQQGRWMISKAELARDSQGVPYGKSNTDIAELLG